MNGVFIPVDLSSEVIICTLRHAYRDLSSLRLVPYFFQFPLFLQVTKSIGAVEADSKTNKTEQSIKNANKPEADISKDKNKAEVS